ncbi:HAD-IIIA family hydrolase [Chromobacterium paludis]|uniref:D,D-heptose 1,7-bisphosphate phosphatase n=1 Tax=Chromobacterium paludis TaxID=2605945 RepID=A0A5C1DM92_9NEIS|nr:HAD-IIIA family hydrolase [Chromobacterium paludis]QEL57712.1 HAD-IIIA family hydrolase [Chromobacterium paludis]
MSELAKKSNVAILAGGMGTRLRERSGDLPKPMVPVLGKPVLQHQIELCRKYGFTDIALLVQHRYEKIADFFGDGSAFDVSLTYVIEEVPRGTAGALRDALPILDERFLVLYGDTFIDVNLRKFWNAHISSSAAGMLLLHPNDHPQDSDLVDIDSQGKVQGILPYPHPPGRVVRNLVNAALYVLERDGLEDVTPAKGKADIAKNMFPLMLGLGRHLHGYITPEYIKDMGTPDRLDKVERDLILGLPERLSCRHLRRAVFLDRDGTLNREVNHLKTRDQLELLPGVAAAVRSLNRNGTLAVVVTNQPVVARGDVTLEELEQIHAGLESELGAGGAFLDGLYFCPHHPDKGFPGEVMALKLACRCRKPEPGLIDVACQDLNIDRHNSWMVGDTTSDIEAGQRAGVRTILLRTGYAGGDAKCNIRADYTCADLSDATDWILRGHADLSQRMMSIAMTASRGKRIVLIGGLARAGKSFAAQVLKELLHSIGCKSHVISLDGWLKPKYLRSERVGVCDRYELSKVGGLIAEVARSASRELLCEPLYDRVTGTAGALSIEHSIGPNDVLIVEGVPALLIDELSSLQGTVKVYIDIDEALRSKRLAADYAWRDVQIDQSINTLAMREYDEISMVMKTRALAEFVVQQKLGRESE